MIPPLFMDDHVESNEGVDSSSSSSTSAFLLGLGASSAVDASSNHDDGGGIGSGTQVVHVSTPIVILSSFPLLCIAYIGHHYELGLENTLLVGIVRSFVQLSILGYILHPIFVMGLDWPWLVGLYVLFMILIATKESMSRPKYIYKYQSFMTFLALLLSISVVGAFAFLFVIRPDPRWNPQYVIPICGMLMGNCINGVSLTVSNLSTSIMEGGRREIELYLSFGASGWESLGRLVKGAVGAGVTPLLNGLNVIGLVSIPGMMTGQILGGSPVTEAAHYQILIMYLIATCTFLTIFVHVFVLYRVAFDAGTHVLRTDRFVEVSKNDKQKKNQNIIDNLKGCLFVGVGCLRAFLCCFGLCGRLRNYVVDEAESDNLEKQPLSAYGTYSSDSIQSNRIQIRTRRLASDRSYSATEPLFQVSDLQFSVPKSHAKTNHNPDSRLASTSPSLETSSPQPPSRPRVLCTNLNISLDQGEIGVVSGPSGCGKSTLLRVLAGLASMDHGDVNMSGMSLARCGNGAINPARGGAPGGSGNMVDWRNAVRYVTQYKVDIPGTPKDFIRRIAWFSSYHPLHSGSYQELGSDEIMLQTMMYLQKWGMGEGEDNVHCGNDDCNHLLNMTDERHPYLDKEWKVLSGGESQRTLLAIAMASRPRILLLDEATSGLDSKTEKWVEESVVDYVKKYHAAVLWVTHSEDIAERILTQ